MPIKIPRNLPAFDILRNEGVMVMSSQLAERQDIRPLKIVLLNLMPEKIKWLKIELLDDQKRLIKEVIEP